MENRTVIDKGYPKAKECSAVSELPSFIHL